MSAPSAPVAMMQPKPMKKKSGRRKKKKDPSAPKRPRSAYILFCTDQRATVKVSHPDAKPADLMKRMGELWNELPATKKQEYNDKAKDDKARYTEAMKSYQPPDDSDDDEPPRKRSKGKKKKKRDPNEPKRAMSAYLLYGQKIREDIKREHPDAKSSEIMTLIGQAWQKLSEEEKKPFNDAAISEKNKYDQAKADYKKTRGGDDEPANDGGGAGGGDEEDDDDGGGDDGGDDDGDDGGSGDDDDE